jgi:hypothetical protein
MLMMLDITDALSLILERSGRRTELQIPTMLALLFALRNLWRRCDGYPKRKYANRNGRNHAVGRGVDDRDGVVKGIGSVGSGSIRCDGYPNRIHANRNGRNHAVGRGVDDRDGGFRSIGHVDAGSIRRDGYPPSSEGGPTGMVATTVLVAVSMTETVSSPALVT